MQNNEVYNGINRHISDILKHGMSEVLAWWKAQNKFEHNVFVYL